MKSWLAGPLARVPNVICIQKGKAQYSGKMC